MAAAIGELPSGFILETSPSATGLPPGFVLEQASGELPPGFQLETQPTVESQAAGGDFTNAFMRSAGPQNMILSGETIKAWEDYSGDTTFSASADDLIATGTNWQNKVREPRVQSLDQIDGFGSFIDYTQQAAGNALGSTLIPMTGGFAGGALGSRIGGKFGAATGAMAGAFAGSNALNIGSMRKTLIEEGVADPRLRGRIAIVGGMAMSSLDALLPGQIAGKLTGAARKEIEKSIIRRLLKGGVQGAVKEGATEGAQAAIEETLGKTTAGKEIDIERLLDTVVENAVQGGIGGKIMGGAGAVLAGPGQVEQTVNRQGMGDRERIEPRLFPDAAPQPPPVEPVQSAPVEDMDSPVVEPQPDLPPGFVLLEAPAIPLPDRSAPHVPAPMAPRRSAAVTATPELPQGFVLDASPPAAAPSLPPAMPIEMWNPSQEQAAAYSGFIQSKAPVTQEAIAEALGGDSATAQMFIRKGLKNGMLKQVRTYGRDERGKRIVIGSKIIRTPTRTKPLSAMEAIASYGGIRDDEGELAARDVTHKTMTPFGPVKRANGLSPDEIRELLVQDGYLTDHGNLDGGNAQTTSEDVYRLIDDELAGHKVYAKNDTTAGLEWEETDKVKRQEQGLDPDWKPPHRFDLLEKTWGPDIRWAIQETSEDFAIELSDSEATDIAKDIFGGTPRMEAFKRYRERREAQEADAFAMLTPEEAALWKPRAEPAIEDDHGRGSGQSGEGKGIPPGGGEDFGPWHEGEAAGTGRGTEDAGEFGPEGDGQWEPDLESSFREETLDSVGGKSPKRYRYAARYRPPGYATVPPGYVAIEPPSAQYKFGVVIYDKPISFKDEDNFELDPLDETHPKNIKKAREAFTSKFMNDFVEAGETYRASMPATDVRGRKYTKTIMVTKSTQPGVEWQLTMMDDDGPSGHLEFNDFDELAAEIWSYSLQGYTPRDKSLGKPTVEPGAEGRPQLVIPGAERASDARLAQRRADAPLRPKAPQKGLEDGLFGDGHKQKELFSVPRNQETFYSGLIRAVEGMKQEKAPKAQWMATIRNAPGVKPEEIAWVGLEDYLAGQSGHVTKAQLLEHLRDNQVQVKEVVKEAKEIPLLPEVTPDELRVETREHDYRVTAPGGRTFEVGKGVVSSEHEAREYGVRYFNRKAAEINQRRRLAERPTDTKFSTYQLPGGENYRELLLTLPVQENEHQFAFNEALRAQTDAIADYKRLIEAHGQGDPRTKAAKERWLAAAKKADAASEKARTAPKPFTSGHWDEPNILAHVRFNERIDTDGKRVLFIEETQSDWHQKGRKQGYKVNKTAPAGWFETNDPRSEGTGVPDAPFKTSWPELAMKRMIRYAAENGFDRIAWTPGDVQAERYDLSKQISRIDYERTGEGKYEVEAYDLSDKKVLHEDEIDIGRVEELLGKEIAKKIEDDVGEKTGGAYREWRQLSGLDLKVGGEGMRGFYDKILVDTANKLGKKFGVRVGRTRINSVNLDKYDLQNTGSRWQLIERSSGNRLNGSPFFKSGAEAADWISNNIGTVAHSLDIPAAMRDSVLQGQPLFKKRQPSPQSVPQYWYNLPDTKREEITARVHALADRILGHRITVGVVDRIRDDEGRTTTLQGNFDPNDRSIQIALKAAHSATGTLGHEAIHALRDIGVFTRPEWNLLKREAAPYMAEARQNYEHAYRQRMDITEVQLQDLVAEEAVAAMFGDKVDAPLSSHARRIIAKIKQFLEALRNLVSGYGLRTAEGVMDKIVAGKMKARKGANGPGRGYYLHSKSASRQGARP